VGGGGGEGCDGVGLSGGREEEGETCIGEEGAGGETKFSEVGGVEPELSRGDRGDLRDVDEVYFEEERTRSSESDDGRVGDEVAFDELDLRTRRRGNEERK